MWYIKLFHFSCFILYVRNVETGRILAIVPTASHSHGIWNRVFVEELAARGHQVVALIADPGQDTKNLRYINIENSYSYHVSFFELAQLSKLRSIDMVFDWYLSSCKEQISSKGAREILETKEVFDLVIFEAVGNECFLGILPKLGVPVVAISAYGCTPWGCSSMGTYEPIAVYPDYSVACTTQMTFLQRLENFMIVWYTYLARKFYYLPQHEAIAKEVFGNDIPPLSEIEQTYFDIMLVNSGPAGIEPGKAHPPSIIEVGCLHCRPGKPLSTELKEFLDGATKGAIFFSLGSNIRSDTMTPEKVQLFLDVFSELKQRVLWKWESNTLPGKPSNVMINKWLPQQDVLAHPNLKVFITHGGRLSTQEAMYHGVPVLSIPIYFDQHINARRSEDEGYGIRLDLFNLTKPELLESIKTILEDSRYGKLAKTKSAIIRDQTETPLERAMFWTEYVIRHGGSPHRRSPVVLVPWYQLYLLDVTFAIIIAVTIMFYMLRSFVRLIYQTIYRDNKKMRKQKIKKK